MTTRTRAELALLLTTFIWGSTFVVAKSAMNDVSPALFIALRFGIGAVLFALFLFRSIRMIPRSTVRRGIVLGLMLGAGIVIQNIGIYRTTASKAAFITGLMVIFTPLAQLVIERRAPKLGNILGVIVVTLGLYLLTSPGGSGISSGDLIVLVSALIFGIYIVYLDIVAKTENVLQLSFVQVTMTTVAGALVVPFESPYITFTNQIIASLLYMGICATVFTTYMQTRFQKDTTPTRAVIIFTIEPVITAVLSYFFLGEVLGTVAIAGAVLIVGGILVSEFSDSLLRLVGFVPQESEE